MNSNYRKIKKLFLRQSYLDSWEDYQRSLRKRSYIVWDYVVLTASNEEQAEGYRQQISYRLELGLLPARTKYVVLSDPDGKRVGSGGATFNVLKYIAEQDEPGTADHFAGKRILVIHSGGDSKRVPQYSAIGKLFSPVPRELPNGRPSTLFDEFIIAMTGVAGRIPEGLLVLSGDVLLLFNPLQIDSQFQGAAAISIKEHVDTGKNHGVFLNDGTDHVERFLHKQSEEQLRAMGAVNENNAVDLDTGAVMMDVKLLNALFGLISTDNQTDEKKFSQFVNEKARISFYGDFLYPLAEKSTLEDYYKEAPEGSFCEELTACRTKIWEALHGFSMSLLCLSPAEFIHFGTTRELRELVTSGVDDYEFLGWKRQVITNFGTDGSFAINNSLLEDDIVIGEGAYIEDSNIGHHTVVGAGSILSNLALADVTIPENVVFHGLRVKKGQYVTRVYGVQDNPKGTYEKDTPFLGTMLRDFCGKNQLCPEELWEDAERYLWFANLYPVCNTQEETIHWAMVLCKMAKGEASNEEVEAWKAQERMSLYSSFNAADVQAIVPWKQLLENSIMVEKFVDQICSGVYYKDALKVFGSAGMNKEQYFMLMNRAEKSDFSTKIRIFYDVSRYMKYSHKVFDGTHYDYLENLCFKEIQDVVYENGKEKIPAFENFRIVKDRVDVALPVRVNWGGGWTDTPPYCHENGGVVLNAAITLNGICPVQVTMKRIEALHVEFESTDINVKGTAETVAEIQDCHNPYDFFALHKAALIASGIIPIEGEGNLQEILKKLGGGFYLSTQVIGVPKGSGLGTSSILSGACVKAIFEFFGQELSDSDLYDIVLCMEQIMSTGGGWQDQVGGVTPGIKFITTKPGINQKIEVEHVVLPSETMEELQERFALIYTGQRRLARNLLRDVVGNYIGSRKESLDALEKMERVAALMRFELERGNIDAFAELLNEHWELSKQLDGGSTNTCIDQIFLSCEDLIAGRFISGAGGGGFLQVILKKGVKKEALKKRLHEVFQDSGVTVWETQFI
ncbi:MAG: L-fucokinase [Eubacteriales bacterium]|nr:L-fucokinase [Eubacteriales bacterium]